MHADQTRLSLLAGGVAQIDGGRGRPDLAASTPCGSVSLGRPGGGDTYHSPRELGGQKGWEHLLGARTLLGAPGIATRNKKLLLLGAPGLTTRSDRTLLASRERPRDASCALVSTSVVLVSLHAIRPKPWFFQRPVVRHAVPTSSPLVFDPRPPVSSGSLRIAPLRPVFFFARRRRTSSKPEQVVKAIPTWIPKRKA